MKFEKSETTLKELILYQTVYILLLRKYKIYVIILYVNKKKFFLAFFSTSGWSRWAPAKFRLHTFQCRPWFSNRRKRETVTKMNSTRRTYLIHAALRHVSRKTIFCQRSLIDKGLR